MLEELQYLHACSRIINKGTWVENARTGARCLTLINVDLEYDCSDSTLPILTTKKMAWKSAVAEMLGYIKGYNNAADFRALGTTTWDANANAEGWQNSVYCDGPDDMGYCYGAVGSRFKVVDPIPGHKHYTQDGKLFNQWLPIVEDLIQGKDNRREIVTFYHPGTMHLACLPPCVHTHTFSLLGGTLHLTSYQRSADMALGVPFNMIQCGWLLQVMAAITGNNPGKVYHKIVNAHIYENQIDLMKKQIKRHPYPMPVLQISPSIKTWGDVVNWAQVSDFSIDGYEHHPAIKYPFTV